MQRLKIWIVLMVLWLCGFFTIERLHEPMNIASFVYVLTAILSVIVLSSPRMNDQIQMSLLGVSLGLLLVLKWMLGYPSLGAALPITVTEALALGVTIFLAGRVHQSVWQFQQAAIQIVAAAELGKGTDFNEGQANIYRELRLARHYKRPFALMAISPQIEGNQELLNDLVEEIHRKCAHLYLRGRVAESLLHATDGCATVMGRDDHLIVSLPEVDENRANEILANIRGVVRDNLGIEVSAGMATFPNQELTLRGLLDRAETSMRSTTSDHSIPVTDYETRPVLASGTGS